MAVVGTSRHAFSRIDLLAMLAMVVLGISGVALLLPRARDPARQIECANHLRTIGQSIRSYHDAKGALPASHIAPGYATWAVQIAPYGTERSGKMLEEWNLATPYGDQKEAVRIASVSYFLCPARLRDSLVCNAGSARVDDRPNTDFPGAVGDYACAPTSDNAAYPWDSARADGALVPAEILEEKDGRILAWRSNVHLSSDAKRSSLSRGESVTLLLGEKCVPPGCLGQAVCGDGSIYNGGQMASFARLIDSNRPVANGAEGAYKENFGSWHPGLCQFLMADTSVRIFTPGVDPAVLQRLIPIRDAGVMD